MTSTRHAAKLIVAAFLIFAPSSSHAFGTVNGGGQSAEHEKITRLALKSEGFDPRSLDEIAGRRRSFGAVGAPDNPLRFLTFKEYAHCDGGDYIDLPGGYRHSKDEARKTLEACRKWIFDHLNKAVVEAEALLDDVGRIRNSQIPTLLSCTYVGGSGRAKCNVFEAFGTALHASQDFYSHSNWTDKMPLGEITPRNPPGLDQSAPAAWLDPTANAPFPDGLMSGCYEKIKETDPTSCVRRTRHLDLNKDKGVIDLAKGPGKGVTPRGMTNGNFARAVTVAAEDTLAKWKYLEAQLVETYGKERGSRMICALKTDKPRKTCS